MTGGYTILDLGGNVFTVGDTAGAAKGHIVEGIYDRIKGNNPNKPFLLENYTLSDNSIDTKENARFVHFAYLGGPFEALIEVRLTTSIKCRVFVESNDKVRFIKDS